MSTETKAQHTPGPWQIEPYTDADERLDITHARQVGEDGRVSAYWICELDSSADSDMSDDEYQAAIDTMVANARLIAAAPELLDALKALIGYVQLISTRPDYPDDLRVKETYRFTEALALVNKLEGMAE